MSKLSVGQRSGLLRGGLLIGLLALVIGLVVGCGSDGNPPVIGAITPTSFPVTANLRTNAGTVAANSPATLSGTSTTGTFTPIAITVGANGLVQFNNVPPGTYVITARGVFSGPIIVRQSAVNLGVILLGGTGGTTGGNTGTTTAATTGSFQTTGSATATTGFTTSPVEGVTNATTGTNNATTGTNNATTGFIPPPFQQPSDTDVTTGNTNATTGTTGAMDNSTMGGPAGPFTVKGQLVSNEGTNVGNVQLTLTGNGLGTFYIPTGPTGTFSFAGVFPGNYTLFAEGFNPIQNLTVSNANMGNLGTLPTDVATQKTYSVYGNIFNTTSNLFTGFMIGGVSPPGIATTNFDGAFVIRNLTAGTYTFTVTGGGINPQSFQATVPGPYGDAYAPITVINQTGSGAVGGNGSFSG